MSEDSGEVQEVNSTSASLTWFDKYSFAIVDRHPSLAPILTHPAVREVGNKISMGHMSEAGLTAAFYATDALKGTLTSKVLKHG